MGQFLFYFKILRKFFINREINKNIQKRNESDKNKIIAFENEGDKSNISVIIGINQIYEPN